MHGGYWAYPGLFTGWWSWLALGLLLFGAYLLLSAFRSKKTIDHGGRVLSERQRVTMDDFDGQLMALLTQAGGSLSQVEIGRHLGLPADIVAERLLELERQGLVKRVWSVNKATFEVAGTAAVKA